MSLFGSLMRDMERDPIFGAHTRAMNRMMGGFFGGGFGAMDPRMGMMGPSMGELMPFGGGLPGGGLMAMSPFPGFPDMSQMMHNGGGASHSYSSVSVMSMGNGPDGRPQVYQASSSTRQGPGGVKEIRKSVADTRTGVKKMSIGHHLGDRSHVIEREDNLRTGQREENHDFVNMEEEEAEDFNREFQHRAYNGYPYSHSVSMPSITDGRNYSTSMSSSHRGERSRRNHVPAAAASSSGVTIEELPASDDEAEKPKPTSSAASRHALPSVLRRSPHQYKEKEKRAGRMAKRSKKH